MAAALVAGLAGGVLSQQYGDLPSSWAQAARLYHGTGGHDDELMEVVGCVLEEPIAGGKSMQCREDFLWLGPRSTVRLALASISNVQVEGYAAEARALTATVGTRGAGTVDRGVILHGDCHGNVALCVVELGYGWELRTTPEGLSLVSPEGALRDVWSEAARPRPRRP